MAKAKVKLCQKELAGSAYQNMSYKKSKEQNKRLFILTGFCKSWDTLQYALTWHKTVTVQYKSLCCHSLAPLAVGQFWFNLPIRQTDGSSNHLLSVSKHFLWAFYQIVWNKTHGSCETFYLACQVEKNLYCNCIRIHAIKYQGTILIIWWTI